MNLHGIVSGVIGTVNPHVPVTLQQQSGGYTTAADGGRTPIYNASPQIAQVQALTAKEIQHLDGLNIQGVLRKAYLNGDWRGVYRATNQGGDLMQFAAVAGVPASLQGTTWKVVQVFETWPDWCALAIQLQ
ncbi:Uncharacterised protein [Burkholderia pseudomallei]|uniref:hypothetical protein n=1 Tax=Burkholderia pseudomallei TaxID=28450 RepID=UPI0005DE2CD7|nr:hypothetical protein [Burkholderia pseudomallei]CAJ9923979.1 Uncharacterised protein [Burkholderia pseudomallei]CAK1307837.1 Uncharacterised protein [Burkholderia pseudomallei]CPG53789.1 Uncharacterised protein [Burkholderia pseudomallei]